MNNQHHKSIAAFLLSIIIMLGPFSIDAYLPAFALIQKDFLISPWHMQQTLSIYLLAYAIGSLIHGPISDALGRKIMMLSGLIGFVFSSILCALAPNYPIFLLGRVFQGITVGAGLVVGRASMMDRFNGQTARQVLSQTTMFFAIAPAIAPIVGGWMVAYFPWQSIFWLLSIQGFIVFLAIYFAWPETLPQEKRSSIKIHNIMDTYANIIKHKPFMWVSMAGALNFSGVFLYIASTPFLMIDILKKTEQDFAYFFIPCVLGMVLGSFTSSKLSRLEENHIIKTAFIVMLLSILCNIFLNSILDDSKIFWVVMPIVIYSFGLHIGQSALTVLALKQFTTNRGSASSINGFINTLLSSCTAGMLSPLFSRSALSLALGQAMIVILGLCCFARAHYLIKNIK